MPSRRKFISTTLSVLALEALKSSAQEAGGKTRRRPDPRDIQPGDFVWPKKKGDFVPYNGTPNGAANEEQRWGNDRDSYVRGLRATDKQTEIQRQQLELLSGLSFRDFLHLYELNERYRQPTPYSGGQLAVGHVGIVSTSSNGVLTVIEAVIKPTPVVRELPYTDWLQNRPNELVWLGRLSGVPADDRAKVGASARQHLGKPYNFWNFDLEDTTGFYCSKLAWLAVRDALQIPIDGNPIAKRAIWFSPKQMMHVKLMDLISDAGPYATA